MKSREYRLRTHDKVLPCAISILKYAKVYSFDIYIKSLSKSAFDSKLSLICKGGLKGLCSIVRRKFVEEVTP